MPGAADLIKRAQDPRLTKQPAWVQSLVDDLAHRVALLESQTDGMRNRAGKEIDELRKQLSGDMPDADTYVSMPHSVYADETYDDTKRPLGRGVTVEFRRVGDMEGDGFEVKIDNDRLHVSCVGLMAVLPSHGGDFEIEAR